MHPLIAWLSFIFSPSDDWLLKRAYLLALEPVEIQMTVDAYGDMSRRYPTDTTDPIATQQWAQLLDDQNAPDAAAALRTQLSHQKDLAAVLKNDTFIQLVENDLLQGNLDSAKNGLADISVENNHQQVDVVTNHLFTELAQQNIESIGLYEEILSRVPATDLPERSKLALGLASLQNKKYDKALELLNDRDNIASIYFRGVALQKAGKPLEAVTAWQTVSQKEPKSNWAQMAQFQIAENFFSTGDHLLCRAACERNLTLFPDGINKEHFVFRLATLDYEDKNYASALARLSNSTFPPELKSRAILLVAESLAKQGQSKELYAWLKQRKEKSPTAEDRYIRSWAMAFDKHYDEAILESQIALESTNDPKITPRLLLLQGLIAQNTDRNAEALATYQTIVDRFPNSREAAKSIYATAIIYSRAGRLNEALTHVPYLWAQLTDDVQRKNPETLFWLADASQKSQRWDDADQYYSRFINVSPKDDALKPYAQFQSATVLAKLNKLDAAIERLNEFAVAANEQKKTEWVTLAHLQKGNLLFHEEKFDQAIAEYRSIQNPKAQYYEAVALARMEYYADAVVVWKKLATEHPDNSLAMNGLFRAARTEFELGKTTDAVNTFGEFAKAYPNSDLTKQARIQSAHALYNSGNAAAALPLYQDYLAHYTSSEDLVMATPYLASSFAAAGKPLEEAEVALKGKPPTDALADMRWTAAAKLFNEKDYASAQGIFSRMLIETPAHPEAAAALFYRGESEFQNQAWGDAYGAYHNFVALAPADKLNLVPTALFHAGIALYNQDKLLKAASQFEQLLTQYPNDTFAADARENLYLCYQNLGDWTTMNVLKQKYGMQQVPNNSIGATASLDTPAPFQ